MATMENTMTKEELAKLAHARDVLDAASVPPPVSLGAVRAQKSKDNRLWTPIECLQDAIRDIQSGETICDKVFVIRVDTREEKFNIGYNAANISASQVLAALECAKAQILQEMGYVE